MSLLLSEAYPHSVALEGDRATISPTEHDEIVSSGAAAFIPNILHQVIFYECVTPKPRHDCTHVCKSAVATDDTYVSTRLLFSIMLSWFREASTTSDGFPLLSPPPPSPPFTSGQSTTLQFSLPTPPVAYLSQVVLTPSQLLSIYMRGKPVVRWVKTGTKPSISLL